VERPRRKECFARLIRAARPRLWPAVGGNLSLSWLPRRVVR
jgi:hypothetical protein